MSIFINIFEHIANNAPWSMHIGGRRCGKTYSAMRHLADICTTSSDKIVYLRRTEDEMLMACDNELSDWVKINKDFGYDINFKTENRVTRMLNGDNVIGYCGALSTIRKMRGINFDDVKYILYDEFIPEPHAKKIAKEDWALFSAYETINGAREMLGRPPVQLIMLANIFNLVTPIFDSLGVVDIVFNMLSSDGTKTYYDEVRQLSITVYDESDFKTAKSNTVIGRMSGGSGYDDMSIGNRIIVNDISRQPLVSFRWIASVLDIDLWEHKSTGLLYITHRTNRKSDYFANLDLFRQTFFKYVQVNYLDNNIVYESAHCKAQLAKIFPKIITF